PLAEATIEPGEDATEITSDIGGVAVAVDPTPSADALRPEREIIGRLQRRFERRVDRGCGPMAVGAVPGGIRIGQNWAARAKRGENAAPTRIGCLAQAPQHRPAGVAAVRGPARLAPAPAPAPERTRCP